MSQEFVARKGLKSLKDAEIQGNLTVTQGISGNTIDLDNLTHNEILISDGKRIIGSGVDASALDSFDTTLLSNISGGLQVQIETISGALETTNTNVVNISGDLDNSKFKSKVSLNDTTGSYLDDKIVKGPGIIKSILNEGGNEQVQMKLGPHYLSLASSGIYEGALLSVGATQGTINISAGNGLYIDSTTDFSNIQVNGVTISEKLNYPITNVASQPVTYIGIDKDDNVIEWSNFPTSEQRRNNIFLGVAVHSNNIDVQFVNNTPSVALDITGQLQDLMIGLGFFNLSGNVISPNGTNLNINKSSGKAFKAGSNFSINPKDPHTLSLNALVASSFRYRNLNSSEDPDTTLIDPTTWDDNGTTSNITGSNNQATIQRIYIFPSNQIRIQRGQLVYHNLSDAIDAVGKEAHVTETNIFENGLLLCSLVLRKGATDLSNPSDAQFFTSTRFGELGSVGSSFTGTLQNAYNNSVEPEILTDDIRQAFTLKNGTSTDLTNVVEVQDISGNNTFTINGFGDVNATGSITTNSHLKIGTLNTTKEDGMIWYDNNQITFRENGIDKTIGSGGSLNIEDLSNVSVTSVKDNQVLVYSPSISGWENVDLASVTISGGENFVSKSGDTIQYLDSTEHLKVGNINIGTSKENGHIWYDTEFKFFQDNQVKSFGDIVDDHIMKALEKQIKVHSTNSSITYVGEAEPGSVTSNAVWRIQEIVETGDDISIQWADGNGNFDNIFDDRETLSYT